MGAVHFRLSSRWISFCIGFFQGPDGRLNAAQHHEGSELAVFVAVHMVDKGRCSKSQDAYASVTAEAISGH